MSDQNLRRRTGRHRDFSRELPLFHRSKSGTDRRTAGPTGRPMTTQQRAANVAALQEEERVKLMGQGEQLGTQLHGDLHGRTAAIAGG